jgi:hypothetical protein
MATDPLDIIAEIKREFQLIRAEIAEIDRMLDKVPTTKQWIAISLGVLAVMFPLFYAFLRVVPLPLP